MKKVFTFIMICTIIYAEGGRKKMRFKKGQKVKIKEERLLKGFSYLKGKTYTIKNLQKRGSEIYAILDPPLYVNVRALEKVKT